MRSWTSIAATMILLSTLAGCSALDEIDAPSGKHASQWADEAPVLGGHVQLTFRKDFIKAGEAYFSPSDDMIIFQAIPVPPPGQDAGKHYSMYVAKVTRDKRGAISGITGHTLLSADGSANTCGWFHPTEPGKVLFGSTQTPPGGGGKSGYQREGSKYNWDFPREMEIVTTTVSTGNMAFTGWPEQGKTVSGQGTLIPAARPLFSMDGYDAEGSWSPDGRHILYTHVPAGSTDGDLWIYDMQTGSNIPIVTAKGYDGGPFFSPDGTRITYRSDRQSNDLLQVFTADLVFDANGSVTGIANEQKLTDSENVNWCPFFTRDGNYLVYATSEVGHRNYEVFAVPSRLNPDGSLPARTRVTHAEGFDGLPVFSHDGKWMMWTSQRGGKIEGEERPSSQLWAAQYHHGKMKRAFGK